MTVNQTRDEVSVEFLEAFGDAWNRHDVDDIMTYFADDCVFITGWGARFEGPARVREGVTEFFRRFPDGTFSDARHFVRGDRGLSEWFFSATGPEGEALQMAGCDVFTFRDGKVAVKDAFRKNREA